ncbi:MAG: hypothetical protein FWC36_06340 [Spirochaetes bacterium]|nr:hypothetical protein [Spirochaetota bacterium]
MASNHKSAQQTLTAEDVWAMFRETDRQMKESAKEIREQMKETDRQMKEAAKRIKELSEQMGGLHNKFGELAEHLVAPGIVERFNNLGYRFTFVSHKKNRASGGLIIHDEHGKVITEIDILLENGEYIIAVEVKTEPKEKDIEHHIKRLKIMRESYNKSRDTRKILGAIAGAIFPYEVKKLAHEAGFYVLEQSGDTMKMDIPDDFVPSEW